MNERFAYGRLLQPVLKGIRVSIGNIVLHSAMDKTAPLAWKR
jgi:hypothetical protein